MDFTFLLLIGAVAVLIYVISFYNGIQSLKTKIKASIQEIGNQLKRQASLIPNLETSVKGYLKHEKGIFEMLTEARKSVAKADKSGSATDINNAIERIQAMVPAISVAVEDNPELKADATVTKFMDELTDTADKLTYARRSLIDLTQMHNERIRLFPGSILAGVFGFKEEAGLGVAMQGAHMEVSDSETKDVKVSL